MTKKFKKNKGMTYVELIVVLGIFSAVTSVVMFDYGKFQSKVDIKNLANDIALKFIEAQKSATTGKWNLSAPTSDWKPSYGVFFDLDASGAGNKAFIYFVDLDTSEDYDEIFTCPGGECLEKLNVTKGNIINKISIFYLDGSVSDISNDDLSVTFTRPSSSASFKSNGVPLSNVDFAQVDVLSSRGQTSPVKIFSSGRIQIN